MRRPRHLAPSMAPAAAAATNGNWRGKGLTEVQGIRVGHHTLTERPTGCTVILVAGRHDRRRDVSAAARRARGRPTCSIPSNMVADRQRDHAVGRQRLRPRRGAGRDALSRGAEHRLQGRRVGVVPIVPAAILFDLGFGGNWKIRPTADCGYKAAQAATDGAGRGRQRRRRRRRDGRQDGPGPLDERRARLGLHHPARRPRRGGAGRGQRGRRRRSIPRRDRSWPACGPRTARGWPTRGQLLRVGRADAARTAARRREHHDRRRRHQREADEGAGAEGRADGARRLRARDLPRPHARGRRHDLLAGDRRAGPASAEPRRSIGALAAEAMADAIVRAVTQSQSRRRRRRRRASLGTVPARFK